MGGATAGPEYLLTAGWVSFNRRGDSLGGATLLASVTRIDLLGFQSQRRFFGGSNASLVTVPQQEWQVSIAEAILWGEQLQLLAMTCFGDTYSFNRRGDSLGGATSAPQNGQSSSDWFQSQRRFFGGSNARPLVTPAPDPLFQSQRRFFGGSNSRV